MVGVGVFVVRVFWLLGGVLVGVGVVRCGMIICLVVLGFGLFGGVCL